MDPALTADPTTWTLQYKQLPEKFEVELADLQKHISDASSPVMAKLKLEDFHTRSGDFVQRTVGSEVNPLLVNHNLYAYHSGVLRANALLDADTEGALPPDILKNLQAVDQQFA